MSTDARFLLLLALVFCAPNESGGAEEDIMPSRGIVDVDNQQLAQGNRIAILLVGLFKPKVTDLVALP